MTKFLPFPSPMRIGSDICSIFRIWDIVARDQVGFVRRVLTEKERECYKERLLSPLAVAEDAKADPWKRFVPLLGEYLKKNMSSMQDSHELISNLRLEENPSEKQRFRISLASSFGDDGNYMLSCDNWRLPEVTHQDIKARIEEIDGNATMSDLELALALQMKHASREKWPKPITSQIFWLGRGIAKIRGRGKMSGKMDDEQVREVPMYDLSKFLAGRFAAKEAIIKAHRHRRITYHDIDIITPTESQTETGSSPPVAIVKSQEGDEHPYREVQVSISHDRAYATATALVCEPSSGQHEPSESSI
ncbi:hypothetical protein HYALB_00007680 [Hymenoscyphus albidus]|uniref:4'-phosphopantetheinyl transferase domain-containing protein n=1 Tax=Hymenoscyphus albidus TaxID=595503 RepID=A0A9N9LJK8_9HELO|nr:hypothetical protein HYALB_00007680 [Hymenoscyphus albidus]